MNGNNHQEAQIPEPQKAKGFVQIMPAGEQWVHYTLRTSEKIGTFKRPLVGFGLRKSGDVVGLVLHHRRVISAEDLPGFACYSNGIEDAVVKEVKSAKASKFADLRKELEG